MKMGKGILGFAVVLPMLLAACSGASPEENLGTEDEALKAAPGCQPPPPGGQCVAQGIALPNGACVGKLALYSKAEGSCKPGQKLSDFTPLGVCPGGVTGAKFLCCDEGGGPPPPPPPPRKCFSGGWSGNYPAGASCPDANALSSQVQTMCAKQGYIVNSFSIGGACAAGGFDGATFECCEPKDPPPPPPPPPPPRKCFAAGFVNASGPGAPPCPDGAALSSQVQAICAAAGYEVNTFGVGAACPGGGWNGATYECCEPKGPVPSSPPPSPPPSK